MDTQISYQVILEMYLNLRWAEGRENTFGSYLHFQSGSNTHTSAIETFEHVPLLLFRSLLDRHIVLFDDLDTLVRVGRILDT